MKRLLPALCFLCIPFLSYGQTYGNEWIHFDQQYLKIRITQDGIYRIDYTTLNEALAGIGVTLASVDPHHFQIFNKGAEQYIYIAGESDGVFDPSDFIEFFGMHNDGTFDSQLFDDPIHDQLQTYTSIINDTAAYFLTWNTSVTNKRIADVTNDLAGAPPPEPYCSYHSLQVYGTPYGTAQYCPGRPYASIYSSKYDTGEGFTTDNVSLSDYAEPVSTPHRYTGPAFIPSLKTAAIGTNDVAHHIIIAINAETVADTSFTGFGLLRYTFYPDNLVDNNYVHFISGPSSTDYQRYAFVDILYPRLFDFDNVSKTQFDLPNAGSGDRYLEIQDFDEKGTSPILYDITDHKRMTGIVESDISKFHLPYNASSHHFYLSSQDPTDIKQLTALTPVEFINYGDIGNQGNYLIISNPVLYDDGAGTNWVEQYRAYRASVAGGSYIAKTIDIHQLYDQFSYGISEHPLAIRNFALYAKDHFSIDPEYIFLIGKSYSYDLGRAGGFEFGGNLVPTFGNPGSDNLLTARPGSVVPVIPVGRLTVRYADGVRRYYEKVLQYEAAQADPVETIENKAWMKNVLHFAGGLDDWEQFYFDSYLDQFGEIINDTLFGANVKQFNKLSSDPIYYVESDYIDSLINNGVSLITFFGHSAASSFDYNIGDPTHFENTGKYFVVYSNGCNVGAVHGDDSTLTEQYILAENRAAVAFIGSSTFSVAGSLYTYGRKFYEQLSAINYHNTLGKCMQATIDSLWPTVSVYDRMTLEHNSLEGDPALHLNTHAQPDYAIEASDVYFDPEIISASDDSFTMHLIVTNLGMAIDTSYFIQVKRTKPDGETVTDLKRVKAPYFRDTVSMSFLTDDINGIGLNTFDIRVDEADEIAEPDEMNNILSANAFIISNDAIPIYPYTYSIMNHIPQYLAASTADPFAPDRQYDIQLDTTMLFNSPLFRNTSVTQSGGVLKWNAPPELWLDNTVYYWRVEADSLYADSPVWHASSFLYLPGDITGWNQSHYFQYLPDSYYNMDLGVNRKFEFINNLHTYYVSTGTANWYDVSSYVDGDLVALGSCAANGFVVYVIDPGSGDSWQTHEIGETNTGPYGDVYCSTAPFKTYIQFNTDNPASREALYQFLTSTVPDSMYVVMYSNGYPAFDAWNDDVATYGHSLFDAFEAYGATDITTLATYDGYDHSYIFYAKKGDPSTKYEQIGPDDGSKIDHTFIISGFWNQGSVETPHVGQAASWDKVQWHLSTSDTIPGDVNGIDLIGVHADGSEDLLSANLQSGDTSIAGINAETYPFVRLKLHTYDDSMRTPAQIDYWRVVYTPVPEAALDPHIHYVLSSDSVQQGQNIHLEVALDNVGDYDMDSMLYHFTVRDQNNVLHPVSYPRLAPLASGQTQISSLDIDTRSIPAGKNTLIIEANPDADQPEQYHFNNLGYVPFYNAGDNQNPLLDVTFDGVHIFNGDIVSAKPDILISLKDENPYLAMSDTSLVQLSLRYPDGNTRPAYYDGVVTRFYPADPTSLSSDNTAKVEMTPDFDQDGIYVLRIAGQDASGNAAGDVDYSISFEVINKPMISNVFNYPNPFTSQTHFVFTITGSEVPEYFKIQIMTVSGHIIREIMRNELGPLHIGNNITEFTWDGTDQYGDPVANGLYLYRVVAKLHDVKMEHFENGTDQYFKSGFGKMYIAR